MKFTPKEKEVVDLLCLGKTDAAIAQILGVTNDHVSKRVQTILLKLNAENRTQAVAKILAPHLFQVI